jgi:hypothetical protein
MHALLAIALVLGLAGVVLIVVAVVRRFVAERSGLPLRIGLGALAGSLVIALSLAYAQPEVCSVLGGSWRAGDKACAHELGGNGSNDPSNNRGDPWPWTLGSPGGNWFELRWADLQGESGS